MKRALLCIVLGSALVLNACSVNPRPARSINLTSYALLDPSPACPRTRWIAILAPRVKTCPQAPGFQGQPLFGPRPHSCFSAAYGSPDPVQSPPAVAAAEGREATGRCGAVELDRFCVYEAVKPSPILDQRPAPRLAPTDVTRVDADCQGATAMGGWMEEATWQPLEKQFLDQVGRSSHDDVTDGTKKVRIAFVDTQPDGRGAPLPREAGCSPHGYSLAHMSRRMLCRPGDDGREVCAAGISTRLALKVQPTEVDPERASRGCQGGVMGWISDLAAAIQAEVDEWADERSRDEQHLILNLSVGWDGDLFGGLEGPVCEMSAPVQAVYRALEDAAAKRILVLAAAGNATFGPAPRSGPILPAAWEDRPPTRVCGTGVTRPLVYAVGGVRWDGSRMFNARPAANPPRVAYGDHGVVATGGGGRTATLTGTSVATAVVSSAAAIAWGSNPALDPQGVIDALETAAIPVSFNADFGATRDQPARRICLHGACPDRVQSIVFDMEAFMAGFAAGETVDGDELTPLSRVPAACQPGEVLASGRPTASFCPKDEVLSVGAQPWVWPQPENDPCPNCGIKPPERALVSSLLSLAPPLAGAAGTLPVGFETTLYVDVPPSWWQGVSSLQATTLDVVYGSGPHQVLRRYSIGRDLSNGKRGITSLVVKNLPVPVIGGNPLPIVSAVVNFLVERDGKTLSVSSPLFLPIPRSTLLR